MWCTHAEGVQSRRSTEINQDLVAETIVPLISETITENELTKRSTNDIPEALITHKVVV